MNIPKDVALSLTITNAALRPFVKKPTADAIAEAFGCTNVSGVNIDPTVAEVLKLTDKQIIDAPKLDQSAIRQIAALRRAINV